MSIKSTICLLALAASSALAHFTLDYPLSRGFDEDLEPQFCGGFLNVESPRDSFPLSGGPIQFTSHHTLATVGLLVSLSPNPTTFANFTQQANGTKIPFVANYFQVSQGSHCFNTDFAGLGLGLGNGSQVTIQMQFNGGDGNLFQCADLVLLSSFTAPSNVTCTLDVTKQANSSVTATPAVGTATSSGSASTSASSAAATSATAKSSGERSVLVGGAAGVVGLVGAMAMLL